MSSALYPGTFDPITNGHYDVLHRCAKHFSRVVVAIAASPGKQPLFDLTERKRLATEVLSDLSNVEVVSYTGLTVDVARELGLGVIVRGLRSGADFEYERQLADMNRHLNGAVDTVFVSASESVSFISATLVREIASMGGDINPFVHPAVAKALQQRFAS